MRNIVRLVLAFTTLFPARITSQAPTPAGLVGRWAGTATFFNRDLQAKVGPVPFVAEFTTETAKLSGFIGQDPALAKDRLVIVITKLDATTIQAEFHLKSNFIYDPRMREGRVTLERVP